MPTDFWNYCLEHWGSKYFGTTLKYLDRESKYFEVVGPHGGPVISEGVQILQHYSEVIGPEGPNTSKYLDQGELFQGGPFFRDSPSFEIFTTSEKVDQSPGN